MLKIAALISLLMSSPALAAVVCSPYLQQHKAPWEGNAISDAGNNTDRGAAFAALDAVVPRVEAFRYPSNPSDALAYVKCIASAVAAEARGNTTLRDNLRAWIAAR